jgi:hypothetical protein
MLQQQANDEHLQEPVIAVLQNNCGVLPRMRHSSPYNVPQHDEVMHASPVQTLAAAVIAGQSAA